MITLGIIALKFQKNPNIRTKVFCKPKIFLLSYLFQTNFLASLEFHQLVPLQNQQISKNKCNYLNLKQRKTVYYLSPTEPVCAWYHMLFWSPRKLNPWTNYHMEDHNIPYGILTLGSISLSSKIPYDTGVYDIFYTAMC